MRRTQVLLTEELYKVLAGLAEKTDNSISSLVRKAVTKTYLRPDNKQTLPAYGIWKNRKETDQELLEKLGGNWKNFPLKTSG